MKHRPLRLVWATLILALPLAGCTPLFDGLTEGIADGVSAAAATFIEELADSLVGGLVPDEGA